MNPKWESLQKGMEEICKICKMSLPNSIEKNKNKILSNIFLKTFFLFYIFETTLTVDLSHQKNLLHFKIIVGVNILATLFHFINYILEVKLTPQVPFSVISV
jgi:hypothetical protein